MNNKYENPNSEKEMNTLKTQQKISKGVKIKTVFISLLFIPFLVFILSPVKGFAHAPATTLPNAGLTPESALYFLDKLGEVLEEFFTFDPEAKAHLQVDFAAERIAEIKIILETKGAVTKGLEVAKARLEAHAAKAVAIVEKEKQKGKDVSTLAGEIVDDFHFQRKAAKQAFDDAKEEFKAKKIELHLELLAAIEAGDTALQEQIRAELVTIEAAKDEAEEQKDATIAVLEAEKDRLQDELEEEKRQEDEARDAAEEALEEQEEAEEAIEEAEEELAEIQEEAEAQGVAMPADALERFNDLLAQAQSAFAEENYAQAKQLAEKAEDALEEVEEVIEKLEEEQEKQEEQIEKEAERAQEQLKKEQEEAEEAQKQAEELEREAEEKSKEMEDEENE